MFEYISFNDIEQNSNEESPTLKDTKTTCSKIEDIEIEKDD